MPEIEITTDHDVHVLVDEIDAGDEEVRVFVTVEKSGPWRLHLMSAEDVGDTYELDLLFIREES